jgi:hypothetical protein
MDSIKPSSELTKKQHRRHDQHLQVRPKTYVSFSTRYKINEIQKVKQSEANQKRWSHWLRRFVSVFFERRPGWCCTRWWHGRAYYEAKTDRLVMVIYPFHWAVNLAWWLNLQWSKHRHKESWIDRNLSR